MDVEKIRMKVTLKSKKDVWLKGTVLSSPFPVAITAELRAGADTIEILERTGSKKIIRRIGRD